MSKNYIKSLNRDLNKLIKSLKVNNKITQVLPNDRSEKELICNRIVLNDLKKAQNYLKIGSFEKAANLICNIPYTIYGYGVDEQNILESKTKKKRLYVGSNAVYSKTDTLRHYIRMIDLTDVSSMRNKKIWNNVLVIG